jgi:hypothetical protein
MSNQVVTVVGGNLFSLAAAYLNDPTQWIRIAQSNEIDDPFLVGVVTLILPPIDQNAGGGVPYV